MEHVLITGGTGTVGQSLAAFLIENGYRVTILSRSPQKYKSENAQLSYAYWNPVKKEIDQAAFQSASHIINLAGGGVVDKRWSKAYKNTIVESRVQSGECILHCLKHLTNQVQSILSASAIGWYGPDQENGKPFTESDPPHIDFLGQTCVAWEKSVQTDLVRVCTIRIGIVLSRVGGALPEFEKPLRFGIAAIPGTGKQTVSWIHVEDLCRIFLFLLQQRSLKGAFNAVSPQPVSSGTLTTSIGRVRNKGRFFSMHIPALLLKLIMGESSIEILKSTTVSSQKIIEAGFVFHYPELPQALASLYEKQAL
ncbi:MAG: TIGR01777 family oxidoreductase [Ferruginibacter sp.]